jgi:RimJ/RimL family protein N-acetyltransferase
MTFPASPVEGVLDDGQRVAFRPLRRDDRESLREAFARMSPQSRYRRFFSPLDHLSEQQLDYLTNIDFKDHVAWIAFLPDEPGAPGVGVARWVRDRDDPEVAEAAVAVIDDYHRRGIGRALLRLLTESAVSLGVKRFQAFVLGDNDPMLTLFQSLGAHIAGAHAGTIEVLVPLPDDIEQLQHTPAPRILRATAQGRVEGRTGPRGQGTHFFAHVAARAAEAQSALKEGDTPGV